MQLMGQLTGSFSAEPSLSLSLSLSPLSAARAVTEFPFPKIVPLSSAPPPPRDERGKERVDVNKRRAGCQSEIFPLP